jgi:hypothetical protein
VRFGLIAVRFALAVLAGLPLTVLVACGSEDGGEKATPVTLSEQMLKAEDAPGSKPDPVEKREMTVKFDEFIQGLGELSVDADTKEMTAVFKTAGFKGAGTETRFYGEEHTFTPPLPHVFGSAIQLESEEGATSALDWLEADIQKPCPQSCAVQVSEFDVDDIPAGRGTLRSATAEDIKRLGTPDEQPFSGYWVGFTNGSSVYTVFLQGPPGSVSEEQALTIASAYYDRLAGN